ncbi:MAG: methyl-accepting chemotaxis protein [Xanthobacteraceae bacterium]|uniref:methyl-accepting chemotaxis protein n=1 Tax=Pseudolabrys sp. TaxID=1960880 RepID=UPI003D1422E2
MHIKVRTAINALAVVVSLGIVAVAAFGAYQFRIVGVGGSDYEKVIMTKDLLADIMPPPAYVIEAYLEATLAHASWSGPPAELRQKITDLHKDYNTRRAYWQKSDLPKDLVTMLTEESHAQVEAFWNALEKDLLPALMKGDKATADEAYATVSKAYAAHRAVIDKIVKQASALGTAIETDATANIKSTGIEMAAALGVLLLILIGGIVAVSRGVIGPILKVTKVLSEIATGNNDVDVPATHRKDEIGVMANAALTLRDNLAENARKQAEANERDRAAAERDRKALAEQERLASEMGKQAEEQRKTAEREAAAAAMMSGFAAEVNDTVNAATNGDFSRRIALDGKAGIVLDLAESLNRMGANVEKVMADLTQMMDALANGDLTRRIAAEYHGIFHELKSNANGTAEQLASIVADINAAVTEVSNASSEVSTSTVDLSQRTEEQAAGLEETAASMEEMSATVKKNAENARHANELTMGTRTAAEQGGKVAASAMQAMSRIEESSAKIADIIGVIDEIARQTNLLALNAAVEAARAGDAGRGFAVVASEVRSLAQRSSQAAKDIKDLITNSNTEVKEGVSLVNSAGNSLSEIMESVKSVADIVADIATASAEQATGLDQVNKALTQIDEMTQQNSALVEENAATAKTLEQQAAAMKERVAFFRLAEGAAPAQPAKRAEPAKPVAVAAEKPAAPKAAAKPARAMPRTEGNLAVKEEDWQEF